ncbi:molecular chaperone DnaJ [Fusobacterium pseudoperiodonticum]|uniref:Molecular chaperone DnaJ n=1 Tax=Fusobacterium pseudoperiodonticum TaxID=2663009 RepID=A0AAD0F3K9_9FUSO|nr:YkvA family protein [Fusobacterium pseudoperiodonticum]ATV65770.1 molecular chaperone DnaJ [Fusobacterium pseudoperiodonticum]
MDRKYFECMTELGLEPSFTEKDLRKKWLELLKKYHPDKYQTEDESIIKFAEEKIIKINEAYEYLKENFLEDKEEDIDTMDYDYEKYTDDFSEGKFWDKIKDVAKKIGLKTTSYALILYYVLQKKEVPFKDKMLITGCLGYFILPIDLIPDFIPIAGYTDDVAGMIFAIRKCMDYVDDEIKQNVSNKLVSWFDVEKDYVDNLLKDI